MSPPTVLVLGGGIAGLTTAHALRALRPDLDVVLLEARDELGGNVRTLHRDGCTVELGPDAFLNRPGDAEALCHTLGLGATLLAPDGASAGVMVAHRGGMLPLPDGLALGMPRSVTQLASTRLLSPLGKARAAMDLFLPDAHVADESVGAIVGRRFGREVKHNLVEPLIGGIYGGDLDELDAAVVMPMFANVRGSLIRALARTPRPTGGSPMRAPGGGLDGVVRALAESLGDERIIRGVAARSIARSGRGWRVTVDGAHLDADALVLATPPDAGRALLEAAAPDLAEQLGAFRLRPALTVVAAFARGELTLPRSSGVLIPRGAPEPLGALSAVTFVDRKWPGRVAEHLTVVRAAFRPASAADWIPRTDDAIAAHALEALRVLLALPAPRWTEVERFEAGTPCPTVGHIDRAARCREAARALGGLSIVGAAVDGPGLAGCIRGATQAAAVIVAGLG